MKTIFKICTCVCCLLATHVTHSQLLKRIQNKVENRVEEKVEQKAIEEAEKAADNMLDKMLGNKKVQQSKDTTVKSYHFNQSVTIQMQTEGNESATLDFLFDSNDPNVICMKLDNAGDNSGGQVYAVITPTESTMFMNMPGMKIKKKVTNDQLGQLDYSSKIPQNNELSKTGRTKTILGYTCEEYTYENDGGKVYAWVANSFPIKGKFVPILAMKKEGPFEGFVMELKYEASQDSGSVKVIKVDTNADIKIDTNAYKSM
ncbi:DUF4412 domain-containing protein [Kordia zhangzhouensis]|uniref:DUF4412 domain-containing protein n=1 Tax=Kordia zhangzhouensis TaxID=1620405 RepID=UPI0006299B68|nr:DUF4412 domain-containing protein [Kordia zhangzhouensis]